MPVDLRSGEPGDAALVMGTRTATVDERDVEATGITDASRHRDQTRARDSPRARSPGALWLPESEADLNREVGNQRRGTAGRRSGRGMPDEDASDAMRQG